MSVLKGIADKCGPLFHWLSFGAFFAFLPFGFDLLIFFGERNRPPFYWYYLWDHGELLLVATAFAADGIGDLYRCRRGTLGERLGFFGLLATFAAEAFCFALVRSRVLD